MPGNRRGKASVLMRNMLCVAIQVQHGLNQGRALPDVDEECLRGPTTEWLDDGGQYSMFG